MKDLIKYRREWRNKNKDKANSSCRKWREEHPEKAKECSRRYEAKRRGTRMRNPEQRMFWSARGRAKAEGLPFTIKKEDIVIPEKCPILGRPLVVNLGAKRPANNSPSLDKIIPEQGYIPGNVQVISHKANSMKRDATLQELIQVGEWAGKLLVSRHKLDSQQ